jgi:hypothetical protein
MRCNAETFCLRIWLLGLAYEAQAFTQFLSQGRVVSLAIAGICLAAAIPMQERKSRFLAIVALSSHSIATMSSLPLGNYLSWFTLSANIILFLGLLASFSAKYPRSLYTAFHALRYPFFALYFFSAFHKMNQGFFDAKISCLHWIQQGTLRSLGVFFELPEFVIPILAIYVIVSQFLAGTLKLLGLFPLLAFIITFSLQVPLGFLFTGFSLFVISICLLEFFEGTKEAVTKTNVKLEIAILYGFIFSSVIIHHLSGFLVGNEKLFLFMIRSYLWIILVLISSYVLYKNVMNWEMLKNRFVRQENIPDNPYIRIASFLFFIGLFLNGLSPYFGIKNELSFAMFSNLHTEQNSNHFVLGKQLRMSGRIDNLVTLVKSSDPQLYSISRPGWPVPEVHLARFVLRLAKTKDKPIALHIFDSSGKSILIADANAHYSSWKNEPWLSQKIFSYRATEPEGEKGVCRI